MESTREKLESLFATVFSMPEVQQEIVVEALSEITSAPHELSDEERRVLHPALARAEQGEFANGAAVRALLDQTWTKPGA